MEKLRLLVLINILFLTLWSHAQVTVTNKGVAITNTSSSITVKGNYVNASAASIANEGLIYISGDLSNYASNKLFDTELGRVVFNGSQPQNIYGDSEINFFKVEVNNAASLILNNSIQMADTLFLIRGNINLNGNNINLGINGYLDGETNGRKIFGSAGSIKALRYINSIKLEDNIAGIGISLSTMDDFGYTNFERAHVQQSFQGDSGIFRYYNFSPSYPGHIDTLQFSYLDNSETIPDEFLYKIFSSPDSGIAWNNKGGLVDTFHNFVLSTTVSPPDVGNIRWTIFPSDNFATCLPNNPDYISAVFLSSSVASNGDSVKFINLSETQSVSWNFGDASSSPEENPFHVYKLPVDTIGESYFVSMTVSNGTCTDTRRKSIQVNPVSSGPGNRISFRGIVSMQIFPNPHAGIFHVEVKTFDAPEILVDLMDSEGNILQKIVSTSNSFQQDINMEEKAAGLYFFKVQAGNEQKVVKLLKF